MLDPVRAAHVIPLAIHPAMTFSGTAADLAALADCCFGVTAPEPARPVAEALVVEIGGEPVWVEEADRARYHAALVARRQPPGHPRGAGHAAAAGAGVEAPDRVLGPLLSTALDNALRSGDAALTGPVARGDAGTVAAHLRELRTETLDVLPAYVAMARATAERALASGRLAPTSGRGAAGGAVRRPSRRRAGRRWREVELTCTVAHTRAELDQARAGLGRGPVAVVMTLGALHEGHATLIRRARERAAHVIVTIFLNPLQFGPGEDLSRYPRTIDSDLVICAPRGRRPGLRARRRTWSTPAASPASGSMPGLWARCSRGTPGPGHFDGVLTVVGKLLHLTGADLAYFGQKDAQQLLLIRRMVQDLDFPVEVVAVPTVREPDGLAMSSRNMYLTASDRESALSLSRALRAGAAAATEGPSAVRRAARAVLVAEPLVAVDYLVLVHPETLEDVPGVVPRRRAAGGGGPGRHHPADRQRAPRRSAPADPPDPGLRSGAGLSRGGSSGSTGSGAGSGPRRRRRPPRPPGGRRPAARPGRRPGRHRTTTTPARPARRR